MKHGIYSSILLTTCILFIGSMLRGQQRFLIPITARDNGGVTATDTFGFHSRATYCNDGVLDADLVEEEFPPKPPTGLFDFRFTDHRTPGCLGVGQRVHIQPGLSLDTFKIDFQPGDGGYPFVFSWEIGCPNQLWYLNIQDVFGGLIINVDMLENDSAIVTNPAINTLFIISEISTEYNCPITGVKSELFPTKYYLNQNYPNPFNPSTEITYSLPSSGLVTLRIFDILGREVATLVTERKEAGNHTIEWNADGNTSGIYFYRLVAGNFTDVKKMLLLK